MKISTQLLSAVILLILLLSALTAGVSIHQQQQEIDQHLRSETQRIHAGQLRTLTITHELLSAQVRASLRLLQLEAQRLGPAEIDGETFLQQQRVPHLYFGAQSLIDQHQLVDQVTQIQEGTATIFVRRGEDFIRVATNVTRDGERAIGTHLNRSSAAYRALAAGEDFFGQVDILGQPYITGYSPLRNPAGEVIGAFYVGYLAELAPLREAIERLRVLDGGFVALLDDQQRVQMHSAHLNREQVERALSGRDPAWQLARQTFAPWGYQVIIAYSDDEVAARLWQSSLQLLLSILLASVLLCGVIYLLVRYLVARPLQRVLGSMRDIAQGEGDLTVRLESHGKDEIAELTGYFNQFVAKIESLLIGVRASAQQIQTATQEIAAGNTDLSQRTEEQASSLEETASSLEELTSTVKDNSDNARQARQLTQEAAQQAQASRQDAEQVIQSMQAIHQSAEKMADIIGLIDSIAFQTNILALNAAVEAARAGEQGRGFAVVAAEVRQLAQRSAQAAKEISQLISAAVQQANTSQEQVQSTGQGIRQLADAMQQVAALISQVAVASGEQSEGIEQINQAVVQMDSVTQQNAALVEEAAAAAESLQEQAQQLSAAVAAFQLSEQEEPQPASSIQPGLKTIPRLPRPR